MSFRFVVVVFANCCRVLTVFLFYFAGIFTLFHLYLLLLQFQYSRMGLAISTDASVNTDIKKLLTECRFVDSKDMAVGDFAKAIEESLELTVGKFASAVVDSFELKINAEGALKLSTGANILSINANIRFMVIVLEFWKQKFPNTPIPKLVKQQMHRLACLVIIDRAIYLTVACLLVAFFL